LLREPFSSKSTYLAILLLSLLLLFSMVPSVVGVEGEVSKAYLLAGFAKRDALCRPALVLTVLMWHGGELIKTNQKYCHHMIYLDGF